jgi:4-amino-4-deoxy-L-arabinose transferase-like glycosyltransferase
MKFADSIPSQDTSRLFWLTLLVIAVVKCALLFVAVPLLVKAFPDAYNVDLFSDQYDFIATNLLEGHGYRIYPETSETLLRNPGYVLVLVALFALGGKNIVVVQLFNVCISLLGAWALYRLTRKVSKSELTAVASSAIFLLYPATMLAESRGGLESVFTACAVLLLLAIYNALDSYRYRDFLIIGVLFGVTLLIKSTLALVLPAFFAWLCFSSQRQVTFGRLVGLFAVASVAATIVLSPWLIRNYDLTGMVIPTTTGGGTAAFQGVWVVKHLSSGKPHRDLLRDATAEQQRIATEMGLDFKPGFFPQFYSVDDEVRFYNELGRRARAELLASPTLALKFIWHNFIGFWIQGRLPAATALNAGLVIPFVAACAGGLAIAARRGFLVAPVVLFVAAYIAPHLPILGVARYHTPIVPFLAVFVALWLVTVVTGYRDRRTVQNANSATGKGSE